MASGDGRYRITGIQDDLDPDRGNSLREVPVRMDVDEWFLSQDIIHINQRALFFPAFWAFSQTNPHDRLSWFQIAGIHGKPFVAWDEDAQEGKTESGYCTHNSILFTTWHRPYMLLWEQVIYEMMKKEAERFDERDREQLLEAAKSWRFPFWDWALKKQRPNEGGKHDYQIPLVVQVEEVYVRSPTGFTTVKNAFYQYTMPGGVIMGDESLKNPNDPENPLKDLRITPNTGKTYSGQKYTLPYDKCSSTSRYAEGHRSIDHNWTDGKQNNRMIEQAMRGYEWDPVSNTDNEDKKTWDRQQGKLTASLREAFYRVLTIARFEDFSTKRMPDMEPEPKSGPGYNQKGYAFDSIENIHDNLHGWCGGDVTTINDGIALLGHMSDVTVAAFDPIFWLHHCNIDRLFAIWQMLHEDQWFSDADIRNKDEGNFWIKAGHTFKSTDELRPFRDETGDYYTSNTVREVTRLGYTYPGLEKWLYLKPDGSYNKEGHLDTLRGTLSENYNASWEAVQASRFSQAGQDQNGLPVLSFGEYKQNAVDLIGVEDYVIDVEYDKFALNGRGFTVSIFIGRVPKHPPYSMGQVDSLVGQVINFSSEVPSSNIRGCQNCRRQQDERIISTGRVVLTNALITRFQHQIKHTPHLLGSETVLRGMESDKVITFLMDNLHWRVTSMGEDISGSQIPSLKVWLGVGKADYYADRTKMSRFYDYKHVDIGTEGCPNCCSGAFNFPRKGLAACVACPNNRCLTSSECGSGRRITSRL